MYRQAARQVMQAKGTPCGVQQAAGATGHPALAGPIACLVDGTLTAIAPDVLCLLSNLDTGEGSPDKQHPPPTLHRHEQCIVHYLVFMQGGQIAHLKPTKYSAQACHVHWGSS